MLLHLHVFIDFDWTGNADDKTSTSTYVVYLGANSISRSSRKQKIVARSLTKVEF